MDRPTCETCPFWNRHHKDDLGGQCRKDPPKLKRGISNWPSTYEAEWCGCHPDFSDWLHQEKTKDYT